MSSFDPMSVDLTNLSDPNDPAPEGVYKLEIKAAEWGESKKNEKCLKLQIAIAEGDYAGKYIFETLMWEGGGARLGQWRTKQYLIVAGADLRNWNPEQLVGTVFDARVTVRPGDGQYPPSNNIAEVIA